MQKVTMADVDRAIEVRRVANEMPIEEFALLVAEHTGTDVDAEKVHNFRYIGLNNIDYYTHKFYEDEPEGITQLFFREKPTDA